MDLLQFAGVPSWDVYRPRPSVRRRAGLQMDGEPVRWMGGRRRWDPLLRHLHSLQGFTVHSLFGEQDFEGDARGILLGLFFGRALRLGEGSRSACAIFDANLASEAVLIVGSALRGKNVLRLPCPGGLEMLLKGGLVVADGSAEGVAGLHGEVEIGQRRLDDALIGEGTGGLEREIAI